MTERGSSRPAVLIHNISPALGTGLGIAIAAQVVATLDTQVALAPQSLDASSPGDKRPCGFGGEYEEEEPVGN